MRRVGFIGVAVFVTFGVTPAGARAQVAPGCVPPETERIVTSPPDGAFDVALDSPVVIRVQGDPAPELYLRELVPTQSDAGLSDASVSTPIVGIPVQARWQRLEETDVFVVRPTQPFQRETEYEIEVATNTGLRAVRAFTTGTSIDREPPEFVFGPDVVDDLASSRTAAACGEAEGSYNVSFSLGEANDDGDEGGIEFLVYLTRASGLDGPLLLKRQYQSEGRSLAFVLTAQQVSTPVCVVVDAVDAVGKHAPADDIEEFCFDPLQGSFFEPCAVSSMSPRNMISFGSVIAWMLAALFALRVRALRLRTR